jgi:hypothetical protein
LYDEHAVHYFQGTVDRSAREVFPHDALHLHALEQAEKRGLRYVNLGGVNPGNEGLIWFKRSWGARAMPLSRLQWQSGLRVTAQHLWRAVAPDRESRPR